MNTRPLGEAQSSLKSISVELGAERSVAEPRCGFAGPDEATGVTPAREGKGGRTFERKSRFSFTLSYERTCFVADLSVV